METLWGVWCGGEALVGAGRARFSRTHDGSFGIIMTGVVSRYLYKTMVLPSFGY